MPFFLCRPSIIGILQLLAWSSLLFSGVTFSPRFVAIEWWILFCSGILRFSFYSSAVHFHYYCDYLMKKRRLQHSLTAKTLVDWWNMGKFLCTQQNRELFCVNENAVLSKSVAYCRFYHILWLWTLLQRVLLFCVSCHGYTVVRLVTVSNWIVFI